MCQYAVPDADGVPTDWHLVHLGARALGGFGLILTESTAVSPDARISPQDTGLWDDGQAAAWRRVTEFVHARGTLAGVQLAGLEAPEVQQCPSSSTAATADTASSGWFRGTQMLRRAPTAAASWSSPRDA